VNRLDTLPDLTTRTLGRSLIHLPQVDSTNKYLKEQGDNLPDLTVVIADGQTGGKGRGNRSWSSAPGDGLYMSVLIKDASLAGITRLPLLVAIGVRRGLKTLTGLPLQIKWSNDLLHEGRKLCGILCESRSLGDQHLLAIGIGVNLNQTALTFERLGLVYATSLFLATDKRFSQKQAASAICNALEEIIAQISADDLEPLWDEYRRHCITLGREVQVISNGQTRRGKAVDITAAGSLIVEINGKRKPISAGEASIRGENGEYS